MSAMTCHTVQEGRSQGDLMVGYCVAEGIGFLKRQERLVGGGCAKLRLQSGAFAPDCPVLILVAALRRLPTDSVGRI